MPTRDDAAYKAAYKSASVTSRMLPEHALLRSLEARLGAVRLGSAKQHTVGTEAMIDAETDELARRGLCASVINWWHKKPAGDELEW